jgi:hypothetical protein
MSQVRLYLDEDAMRKALVFGLRARNVDVLTAAEAEMINRDDRDHLAVAATSGRVLYSFNVADYCILHQAWMSEKGFTPGLSSRNSSGTQQARNFGGLCG